MTTWKINYYDNFMRHYKVDCQHRGVAKAQAYMTRTDLEVLLENEQFVESVPEYIEKTVEKAVRRLKNIERMLDGIGKHDEHMDCPECKSPRSHLDNKIRCPKCQRKEDK